MSVEALQNLLGKFGQRSSIANLQADENGFCRLAFDDKIEVDLNLEEEAELLFSCRIGQYQETYSQAVFQELLEGNFFWLGTGGATLSIDSSENTVYLAYQEDMAQMDYARFETLLENFINTAEYWMGRLQAVDQAITTAPSETDALTHVSTGIRV
jgi:hypothetical protein